MTTRLTDEQIDEAAKIAYRYARDVETGLRAAAETRARHRARGQGRGG
jgi:hypothetical protein